MLYSQYSVLLPERMQASACASAAAADPQTTRLQANAATLAPLNITSQLVQGLALAQDDANVNAEEADAGAYDEQPQQHTSGCVA
jgi:hypothetical protein